MRELKPGQIVVVVAGTSNPKAHSYRPIGGAIAIKSAYVLITPKPVGLGSKFLHIWNPWVRENRTPPPVIWGLRGPVFSQTLVISETYFCELVLGFLPEYQLLSKKS